MEVGGVAKAAAKGVQPFHSRYQNLINISEWQTYNW